MTQSAYPFLSEAPEFTPLQASFDEFDGVNRDGRKLWSLTVTELCSKGGESAGQTFLRAVSQDFSAGKYLTMTAFVSGGGLIKEAFAIHAKSNQLLLLRTWTEARLIPSLDASVEQWALFWIELQTGYSRITELSSADFLRAKLELTRFPAKLHRLYRDPFGDHYWESWQAEVSKFIPRIIRFHLARLDREAMTRTLLKRSRRGSLLAYNYICQDPESRALKMSALVQEPFFMGRALQEIRSSEFAKSWAGSIVLSEETQLSSVTVRWRSFAESLLNAVNSRAPLREIIRSHTGLSREANRYLNSLGLYESSDDEFRLIERYFIAALPPSYRPKSWGDVIRWLPVLRYMDKVKSPSTIQTCHRQRSLFSSWKNYVKSFVHQGGWRFNPEQDEIIEAAARFCSGEHRAIPLDVATSRYFPEHTLKIRVALNALSFRRRLEFHDDWVDRLSHETPPFSAAEKIAQSMEQFYIKFSPRKGANVPVPVNADDVQELIGLSGWQVEFIDAVSTMDAIAKAFNNCLGTSGSYAMALLSLDSAFVKLTSPTKYSTLVEIDLTDCTPSIQQHKGVRNAKPNQECMTMGSAVLNLVTQFLNGEQGLIWRNERSRIKPYLDFFIHDMLAEIEAREAERIFFDWGLMDSLAETVARSNFLKLPMS